MTSGATKKKIRPHISQEKRGATGAGRRRRRGPAPLPFSATVLSRHFQLQTDRLSRLSCGVDAGLDELDRLRVRRQKEAVRPHKHVPLHQSCVEEAIVPVQAVHDHGFFATSACPSSACDSSVLSWPDEDAKQLGGNIVMIHLFLFLSSCSPRLQKFDVGFN